MKTYIDVKSKKVYNEGDLYTFVKECKGCGVYCKNIAKFIISNETLKLAEGRLEEIKDKPKTKVLDRNTIKAMFYGLLDAIQKENLSPMFNRMVKVSPKSIISYVIKEIALRVESEMNYPGHIKNIKNPYCIYFYFSQTTSSITWDVKKWKSDVVPYRNGAFFRDDTIAKYVAEEACNIFNSILNKDGKQEDKKRK